MRPHPITGNIETANRFTLFRAISGEPLGREAFFFKRVCGFVVNKWTLLSEKMLRNMDTFTFECRFEWSAGDELLFYLIEGFLCQSSVLDIRAMAKTLDDSPSFLLRVGGALAEVMNMSRRTCCDEKVRLQLECDAVVMLLLRHGYECGESIGMSG